MTERRALILYGRVGTYTVRTASMKKGMQAEPQLWSTCAASIMDNVVQPWRAAGALDIFVQSWNPELAARMDAFWEPVASWHGNQSYTMPCLGPRLPYCDRTQWALKGMKHAAQLRSTWARSAAGRAAGAHVTVLMMRHDVHWFSPMPPVNADGAVKLWLPLDCTLSSCRENRQLWSASTPPDRKLCASRGWSRAANWTGIASATFE